ncbi:hypothetical protein ACFL6S_16185 [Candidatus Poribacteria bacterium]
MYEHKKLLIWVEGPSDQRFFDKVIKPEFERKYGRNKVHIRQYSNMNKESVIKVTDDFEANDDHYICVRDMDKAPCVSAKKQEMRKGEFENVPDDRIIVVIKEMEGWYLAGLNDDSCKRLGFSSLSSTDKTGKGQFKRLQRVKFGSGRDFMIEILKSFDIETAKRKNESFKYFAEKYGL